MNGYFARRLMLNRVEATQITGAIRRDIGGSTVLLHPTLPASTWNFGVDVDTDGPGFDRLVKRVEDNFREAKRWPAWITGPYDRPADVEERLKAHGYATEPDRTVMFVKEKPDLKAETPGGLEIELADEVTVDECVQIAVQRYGWSYDWANPLRKAALAGVERGDNHYRMYYASLNGAGVATAFTVFSAGTAGLYGMATSKDFEGKGIGRALLKHCADDAFERGVDVMTLQVATGSKAEKFYEKAGFEKAYIGRKWVKKSAERVSGRQGRPEEE